MSSFRWVQTYIPANADEDTAASSFLLPTFVFSTLLSACDGAGRTGDPVLSLGKNSVDHRKRAPSHRAHGNELVTWLQLIDEVIKNAQLSEAERQFLPYHSADCIVVDLEQRIATVDPVPLMEGGDRALGGGLLAEA